MKIRRHQSGANSASFPSFLGGMLLGVLVMYVFMIPMQGIHEASLISSGSSATGNNGGSHSSPESIQAKKRNLQDDQADDGWHQIHVFYGDRRALGADPKQQSYAQVHQDDIVVDILGTSGFFIDLAANDALELTNTLALERHKGWNGLCIEPNPTYWYGLSHRKCTVVGALMGDHVQQVDVKFRGVYGGIVGKMDNKLANRKKEPDAAVEKRYTAPITQVLERFHVPKVIDYMSLDVEGAEFLVMQHFPFDQYQIKILTVERPKDDLKKLFEEHGYIFLKSLAWWGESKYTQQFRRGLLCFLFDVPVFTHRSSVSCFALTALWAHKSTGLTPDHPKIAKIVEEGK